MMGYIALFMAEVLTLAAGVVYLREQLKTSEKNLHAKCRGLLLYELTAVCSLLAAGYLFYLLLQDHFEFTYVAAYSAADLPLLYKISAFWAGQEGSFLLWLVFHILFGLVLSRKKTTIAGTMAVYCGVQALLLAVLLYKSPFLLLAEPRAAGIGLNPLLQDFWMAIHPPLLFLGYAGLAVPFAWALGSLLAGKRQLLWLRAALPWACFAWSTLGAGIFIGGYWAYKVLGWGGYWAWDPVENSSLVPWLLAGALVHLLNLAKVRPSGQRPAYLAAIFTFILVLYGSFLTRSGLLSDFSVHSFADEGLGGLLILILMLTTSAGLGLLIWRWPGLPAGTLYLTVKSREFYWTAAALLLAMWAGLILLGMSTPVLTMLFGSPQSLAGSFYNRTSLPLALLLALLLFVATWPNRKPILLTMSLWIIAALAAVLAGISYGIRQPLFLLIIALAGAAGSANIAVFSKSVRARKKQEHLLSGQLHKVCPAALAHLGVACLLLGIIFSSAASQTVSLHFFKGASQEVFGWELTYQGQTFTSGQSGFYQNFRVQDQTEHFVSAYTKLRQDGRAAAREPGIFHALTADLYLAPVVTTAAEPKQEIRLRQGEFRTLAPGVLVRVVDVVEQSTGVQAVIQLMQAGELQELRPELVRQDKKLSSVAATANDYEIAISAVNVQEKAVSLIVNKAGLTAEQLDVEITRKPLIGLVWLGAALLTCGCLWAAVDNFAGQR